MTISSSKEPYDLYMRGMKLLRSGDPAQAAVLIESAKKQEPAKASIRDGLGQSYFNYGRFEEALRSFDEALAIDPTNDYAHFGAASSSERLGQFGLAQGHIKLALAMAPDKEIYQKLARKFGNKKAR